MRLRNLVGLHIDDHIQRTRASDGTVHLVIPGEQVKMGNPGLLPAARDVRIARHLSQGLPTEAVHAREPMALPRTGSKQAKKRPYIQRSVEEVYSERDGPRGPCASLPSSGGQALSGSEPGQYESVRRHLGHRSMETTLRAYAGMETAAASRHFDATILKLRHQPSTPAV